MLLLVVAGNYLLLYVGWEGVGLASYLLIGFWQHKPSAATAAKKAFIVNRVGDVGLSIAVMLMFTTFGTFAFDPVLTEAGRAGEGKLTAIGLMLLLAACGKSAQVPLQSWLGDAMEGPTPVSALIHAATMVTAGVLPRHPLRRDLRGGTGRADRGGHVFGAVTLLFGGDRRLCEGRHQEGPRRFDDVADRYMILAAGLGPVGYVFAIMHLVTHGFFKPGSPGRRIGHARHERRGGHAPLRRSAEVHARHLRHLRSRLSRHHRLPGAVRASSPRTRSSRRPFAKGGTEGWILGGAALLGAAITAYYMTRVMIMTFFGEKRWQPDPVSGELPHPHESPSTMTIPMIVLAVGSVFAGGLFSINDAFLKWLEPVTGHEEGNSPVSALTVTAATMVVLVLGVALAWAQYGRRPVPAAAPRGSLLTRAARRDLLQDDFNHVVLVRGGEHLTRSLVYLDHKLVDGVVNGTAASVGGLSGRMRRLQNGYVRSYAVSMFGGAAVLIAATLLMRAV
ncbi:NADH-quinone oxidoreductase subunit L [Streptomyces thioluteus]|uniref:NADH-quinone oxidoreductase subunit L n=1 Tax=Streptomyces thioluteus TaxID=66431 RepID=A0ABN3WPT3_STRTU